MNRNVAAAEQPDRGDTAQLDPLLRHRHQHLGGAAAGPVTDPDQAELPRRGRRGRRGRRAHRLPAVATAATVAGIVVVTVWGVSNAMVATDRAALRVAQAGSVVPAAGRSSGWPNGAAGPTTGASASAAASADATAGPGRSAAVEDSGSDGRLPGAGSPAKIGVGSSRSQASLRATASPQTGPEGKPTAGGQDVAADKIAVQLWFRSSEVASDGCPLLEPATRMLPSSATPAGVAQRLLAGPTPAERSAGLSSLLPTPPMGTKIGRTADRVNVNVTDATALNALTGSCGRSQLRSALERTLSELPGVTAVRMQINGSDEAFASYVQGAPAA